MSEKALEIIRKRVEQEPYAKLLGMRLLKVKAGYALVEMQWRDDFANIFAMAHGGAIFSLVDEAFEIASNSHGTAAVALNMNITYHAAPARGDTLRAEAKELSVSKRTGSYLIKVTNQEKLHIATCQALVYRRNVSLEDIA